MFKTNKYDYVQLELYGTPNKWIYNNLTHTLFCITHLSQLLNLFSHWTNMHFKIGLGGV